MRFSLIAAWVCLAASGAHAQLFNGNPGVPASEANGMQVLYELNIPGNNPAYRDGTPVPYTVNNSAGILPASYSRVGYYVEVTSGAQAGQFVYVSMDSFDPNPATLGVPHNVNNPVARQTIVNNANIYSNNPSITDATGVSTVNLEMWPSNYATGAGAIPNDTGRYDWSDSGFGTGAGHGSFQIHDHGALQTLFGWSDWGGNAGGATSEFGIGNATLLGNPHEDWTFSDDGQAGFLQIVVGTPGSGGPGGGGGGGAVPEPASIVLWSLIGLGLAGFGYYRVAWKK